MKKKLRKNLGHKSLADLSIKTWVEERKQNSLVWTDELFWIICVYGLGLRNFVSFSVLYKSKTLFKETIVELIF